MSPASPRLRMGKYIGNTSWYLSHCSGRSRTLLAVACKLVYSLQLSCPLLYINPNPTFLILIVETSRQTAGKVP